MVATATKALQEQLLAKDVPAAARALGREVRVAVLKGRQNYLCRRQLLGFGPMLLRDPRDEEAYEALQPWIAETEEGDRAELPFEPSEALWAELAVGSDRCAGRRCSLLSSCFAEAARSRAGEAELVITNHALYFADLAAGGGVLPEHDAVVFDEAHRLEETAATWLGGRVSRAGLRRLAADVERACREARETFPARAVDRIERAGERLLAAVAPASGRRRLREIPIETALRRSSMRWPPSPRRSRVAPRGSTSSLGARSALAAQVEACLEPGGLERVVWAEPDALAWAPVEVSHELRERLWERRPDRDPRLGDPDDGRGRALRPPTARARPRARARSSARPSTFANRCSSTSRRSMPDPRSDGYSERAAEEVVALLSLSRGRALVLTSSYRALEVLRVADRRTGALRGARPGRRAAGASARAFPRREVDSVLLATSTFWQGVDVPGESLSLLVIDKLPVLRAGRPAARGALRGGRGRRRRLVPRLRAARRDAPAPPGLRAPDPQPRGPRRGRDPRPAPAHEALRAGLPARVAALPDGRGPGRGGRLLRGRARK